MLEYFNSFKFKKLKHEGFSLVEVIVAVMIISIGLVGVTNLIIRNISLSKVGSEKIIAVNLAGEGIEVVKNIRDSNWLESEVFNKGIITVGASIDNINVDYDSTEVSDKDDKLYLNEDKRYSHDNSEGNPTIFSRHLELSWDDLGEYIQVKSIVEWRDRAIVLESRLYDWK